MKSRLLAVCLSAIWCSACSGKTDSASSDGGPAATNEAASLPYALSALQGSDGGQRDGGTDASGNGVTDSGDDQPVINGSGATCPPLTDEWVGALLTLNVTWRPVLAANGSPSTGAVPPIYIWTLSHYTINGSA